MMLQLAGTVLLAGALSAPGDWTHVIEVARPPRKGKPQAPSKAQLWVPDGVRPLRGLVVAGKILLEKRLCTDPGIRKVCAEKGLGILYYEPHLFAIFDYARSDCEDRFLDSLARLAKESGHPEIATVPWLTIGHSTGGIFCRNVAYWKPERVLGIIHIKSGNFQDHIQDEGRSLAGVPLLALNGEFEEYGPAGGDLKGGRRARYSLHPDSKTKRNQTQWIMIRMQMIERRRRNPENLMSLVVHRDGGHRDWSDDLSDITARFIRGAADARLPAEGKSTRCRPLKAADGWLTDADIKAPRHKPAAYADYTGDKTLAFWHIDKALAERIETYHRGPWDDADPTAGEPAEKRYAPPAVLRDRIDVGSTGDIVLTTRIDPVDVELFIPKEARPVRGILVHVVHYKLKTNDRWATFCREHRFAHLNTTINLKQNNRPAKLRKAMLEGLKEFAAKADLPELVHVPRAGVGHSAGGMVTRVLLDDPAKTLSNAINCSWVMDPEKYEDEAERVPALFSLGAVPDAFKMLPAIDRNFVPAIRTKRPWALALQHHCAHDWGNAGTLFLPWMQAMVWLRYPDPVDVSAPIPLKAVDFESGWRGDRSSIDGTWATVVPAADFQGKPDDAVWLPDRAMAWIWRAWQSKDAPVQLKAAAADGSMELPPFNPRKDFQMTVKPGVDLVLGIRAKDDTKLSAVRYYRGDRLLGKADRAPWTAAWPSPKPGAYAVWAEYEIDDRKGAANPALICVEP